ncbi:MAG TPA: hypothetical protein VGG48_00825 [Rhizomicrobium sp.]|jgi:hypothetical protein
MTSRESFNAFVGQAWQYFLLQESKKPQQQWSRSQVLRQLYAYASAPVGPAGVKNPLTPPALYESMVLYMGATIPYSIKLQKSSPWLSIPAAMNNAIIADYTKLANGQAPVYQSADERLAVQKLPTGYLHVYPTTPMAGNDWRIALNVEPVSMADAIRLFKPLLGERTDINHIKFLGPGSAGKCDTALVYLKKVEGRYDALRDRIVAIAGQLQLQDAVGGIWNEYAPGIAEASEPPKTLGLYASFTSYRCIVVCLAYIAYRQHAGQKRVFDDYFDLLGQVMALFGLDIEVPYIQEPIPGSLSGQYKSYLDAYLALKEAWT